MEPIPRTARNYRNAAGKSPFLEWLRRRVDGDIRSRIVARIRRIEENGNYGDCEPVGDGVFELRFDIGAGYRVYFGIDRDEMILLGGGDKSAQRTDITKAKECWEDYNA